MELVTVSLICDCCHRRVRRIRSSMWHGQDRLCVACFHIWYEYGITDRAELGAETLRCEAAGEWPFPSPDLARTDP